MSTEEEMDIVISFLNQRSEYVQVLRQTGGDDNQADYWRWQGHAEARRQLSQKLGRRVVFEPGETADAL